MLDNRHARRTAQYKFGVAAQAAHQLPLWRALSVFLAFMALIIQVLVVQSHIHISQPAGKVQSVSLMTLVAGLTGTGNDHSAGTPRDKYPINEDPWNCPICQEFGHSGQFVASAAVLVSLPYSVTISFIVFSETIPFFFAISHNWQGRAPPQR
jgi:hypothetical protein